MRSAAISSLLVALTLSSAAVAQIWTPVDQAPSGTAAALAEWPSGITMVGRCDSERGLDLLMTLAQPVDQDHVAVTMTLGGSADDGATEQRWLLSEDGQVAFARQPIRMSRAMVGGEGLNIVMTPDNGRQQTYELDPPAQTEALADVMHSCGLSSEPTHTQASTPRWVQRPTGDHLAALYPPGAARRHVSGEAVMECKVQADGTLGDCLILSEGPAGEGFGAATLGLARHFRLEGINEEESVIRIPIRWQLGSEPRRRAH